MLILTRRITESVMIGDDVMITVLRVKGNQVRIGIDAPKHVAVHREEIYERIKAAKCADITKVKEGDLLTSDSSPLRYRSCALDGKDH